MSPWCTITPRYIYLYVFGTRIQNRLPFLKHMMQPKLRHIFESKDSVAAWRILVFTTCVRVTARSIMVFFVDGNFPKEVSGRHFWEHRFCCNRGEHYSAQRKAMSLMVILLMEISRRKNSRVTKKWKSDNNPNRSISNVRRLISRPLLAASWSSERESFR